MRLSAKLLNRPALQAQTAGLSSLGKPNLLVVTVDALYKASHTATEINNFVQGGGSVVLVYFSNVFHAKIIGASMCRFGTMFNATTGATEWIMDVDANGTAIFSEVVLASLKNPNAITFTGAVEATYDGSQAVEVKIPDGSPSDWSQSDSSAPDYVKNRTHYAEKAFEDIFWDGDTEGRDVGYLNDKNCFCKVSDQILTVEDLVGSKIINEIGTEIILKESDVVQATKDIIRIYSSAAVVVSTPTTYMGVAFPSAGVYSSLNTSLSTPFYTSAFIAKETVHKLDKKFLPDDIGGGSHADLSQNDPAAPDYVKNRTHYIEKAFEDITWDGDTEGRDIGYINDKNIFYKVSDQTPSVEDLMGATTVASATGYVRELGADLIKQENDDVIVFNYNSGVVIFAPTTYRGTVFPSAGVYFCLNTSISVPVYTSALIAKETVHKLDKKFLPDDIGEVTDEEMLDLLIETDALPAMQDADGSILADENNNILLW